MAQYIYRYIMIPVLILTSIFSSVYATDFSATDINGNLRNLSEFRGKWVVVNFWASWCAPCMEEIPELSRFHSAHKDSDAVVLGINYMENLGEIKLRRIVTRLNINYPVLKSNPEIQKKLGPITGIPTTYLIKPTSEIAAWIEGPITAEMIEEYIRNAGN